MGLYVHIHVCFNCHDNDGVAAVAAKHLPALKDESDGHRAAIWFLGDLAKRTGPNPGPKGGLSLWGMVGNYTNVDVFVEVLRPFWRDLLGPPHIEGGPSGHHHILVFEEREQTEQATAYEISREDGQIVVRAHKCPFAWMQF